MLGLHTGSDRRSVVSFWRGRGGQSFWHSTYCNMGVNDKNGKSKSRGKTITNKCRLLHKNEADRPAAGVEG